MHILVLPSFYPDNSNINLGSFIKEQVETLAQLNININVTYVEQKSLRKLNFINLKKNYYQSTLNDEGTWKEFIIKGWKIPGRFGDKIWIYLSEKLVENYIKENGKPDLIHVHNVYLAGKAAFNINRKYNVPFVITEHSSVFLQKDYLSHKDLMIAFKVYDKALKVIAVSKSLEKQIKKIGPQLKTDIVPNIVDTDFFKPDVQKPNDVNIKFLAIGNLNKNKNHDLLINAFLEVSKINPNVILKICGDGPEKEKLNKKIQELNLEGRVELTGYQNKQQILVKLQESDCLVHTSNFETFGVVLIEALSCGIPIITTKCGGPEDIYEEGVGFMVECGNDILLKKAMLQFITQKEQFSKSMLRSIAIHKYSRQSFSTKLMQIYSSALEK